MYEIKVSGMDCSSCAGSISHVLKSLDPNVVVSVDIKTQSIRVESNQPESKIAALIEETGYPVLSSKKIA